ncbi:uncharacterized protein LOC112684436 [Sipha flava]|uniref:Uncharacterized protein LOC112684436 n=1 Tax=Sipha flava TaxID=143950 RepID=A0A8B8FLH0_9HEMI|nr:uncharacterized protein LOC112684436 [Sipha flava]
MEAIIIPAHKKGDKTKCDNYRGVSFLNSAYKVFSGILLNRIISYSEDCLGEYQCGFRKGRSTTEQLSIIGQIIEKSGNRKQRLKQRDTLSPILFNLALEKVVRILQDNEGGLVIGQNKIQLLGFADDLNIIGDSLADTDNAARVLEEAAKKIGIEINTEKTKIMELIESGEDPSETENLAYEKLAILNIWDLRWPHVGILAARF